jgi:hypothetical protein
LIVDPQQNTVSWLGLDGGEYKHLKRIRLMEPGAAELAKQIRLAVARSRLTAA